MDSETVQMGKHSMFSPGPGDSDMLPDNAMFSPAILPLCKHKTNFLVAVSATEAQNLLAVTLNVQMQNLGLPSLMRDLTFRAESPVFLVHTG